jgi:hypothetical protein
MTATLAPPKVKPAQSPVAARPVVTDRLTAEAAEQRRWVIPLVLAFTWSAAFFAAAIGTDSLYLLAPAGLGVGMIILGFVYLGLTSDTNATQ